MTLKLPVKLTRFNFMNPQAEYSVVSIDYNPLQQFIKTPSLEDLGVTTLLGLKRKHAPDYDHDEEK